MERTKKIKADITVAGDEPTIRWKKLGRGSFRMPNRIIKPGEIFTAKPSDIPLSFRDVIIPVDDLPKEMLEVKVDGKKPVFSVAKRDKGTWYDVIDDKGKKINEKALTKEAAISLVESLR